jgi:hypothetical protein
MKRAIQPIFLDHCSINNYGDNPFLVRPITLNEPINASMCNEPFDFNYLCLEYKGHLF